MLAEDGPFYTCSRCSRSVTDVAGEEDEDKE